ncbi:MAG: hypothetical protein IJS12_06570 [Lachnospiraceae bacterium]|nr:hypothetical protein [Lachnospiraceae bacterium]
MIRSGSDRMKEPALKAKKNIAGQIVFTVTVVICMIAAVVCCYRKQGMHEDEFYSYYSSNRTYGLIAEGTVSRDMIMDELTVREGEGFNFALVKEVQSWDVHPPLYYFVLHFVCSLTSGVFSMWQGLIINLICLFVSLLLMKQIGDMYENSGDMIICPAILAWGLSAATLTGVVFIRMYMLLTVWILAVTLLHLKKAVDIRFWLLLGGITFCGFMTHYYFFIWLFFLAVAWNIREIIRHKSIRTTLYYGLTMIISFGLCYLFYPAFPAQMFRGQRGAQATGNFIDIGNTWERMVFFAEKINRIGFGGILWVLIGLLVIMYLLNADSRRGLRPRITRWSANDARDARYSTIRYDEADEAVCSLMEGADEPPAEGAKTDHSQRCGNDVMLLCCALAGYFLVVSKTALMLGDSSVRYVMPVLGILYLCLAEGLVTGAVGVMRVLTHGGDRGTKYGSIAASVIVGVIVIMNMISDLHGNISFLYPEKAGHRVILDQYSDADVVCLYPSGQSWIIWADMTELLGFDEVTCMPADSVDLQIDEPAVLYLDRGAAVIPDEAQYLYSNDYSDVYYCDGD